MDWVSKLKSAKELDKTLTAIEGFEQAVNRLASIEPGQGLRNNELNKVAYIGGTLIAQGKAQEHWVQQKLREACEENDYIKDDGESQFERTMQSGLSKGKEAEPEHSNPLYKMAVPVGKIGTLPQAQWLIKDLMYEDSTVFLIADPNVGKSFMALDIAAHLADSEHWHGRKIEKNVETVYVTPEGTGNLHKRITAWEKHNGRTMSGITFFPFGIRVGSPQWNHLVDYCSDTKPGLVVIDTWSRNNGGRDENGQADTSLAVEQLDYLRYASGATLLILHHLNKNQEFRGSTTLSGAADTIINLADPGHGVLNCFSTKQKDGSREGRIGQFRIQEIELDKSNDVTSAVFTPISAIPWEGRNNDE